MKTFLEILIISILTMLITLFFVSIICFMANVINKHDIIILGRILVIPAFLVLQTILNIDLRVSKKKKRSK